MSRFTHCHYITKLKLGLFNNITLYYLESVQMKKKISKYFLSQKLECLS